MLSVEVMPAKEGLSEEPRPKLVLTVAPLSYAKAPAPVATINSPSFEAAPKVSKSSKTPSTDIVCAIPSPVSTPVEAKPDPAVIVLT